MRVSARPPAHVDAGRAIATARVVLACAALFAVWLDPADPERYEHLTYALHAVYVTYALGLALLVWRRVAADPFPLVTHGADLAMFAVFQLLTLGPSSPLFVYFVFSLFCGAIRWGWRGAMWTASIVVVVFLLMTASMARTLGPDQFELNRAIVRTVYLIVVAGLLVHLGRHEQRLRGEIERLARWPAPQEVDVARAAEQIVRHAVEIMGALGAVVLWEPADEPRATLGTLTAAGFSVSTIAPDEPALLVLPGLEAATFVCSGRISDGAPILVAGPGSETAPSNLRIGPLLRPLEGVAGLASAPFDTERVSGRVIFGGLATSGAEIVALTEVAAREIGGSLDRFYATKQLADMAAYEERLRVARDLHDGVLQSLTGIRLEIRSLSTALDGSAGAVRDRLAAVGRALAIEQRELRRFIDDLGPKRAPIASETLAARLDALRNRLSLEWRAPVTLRVTPEAPDLPPAIAEAVPLMVHEAVVNALKHAEPSRVVVTVESTPLEVRIAVLDDGHGFPFRGRYDEASLAAMPGGPTSLLARVTSLGGRMSIESSDAGSRVDVQLTF